MKCFLSGAVAMAAVVLLAASASAQVRDASAKARGDYGPAASSEPADAPSMPRDYSIGNWRGTRYYAPPSAVNAAPATRSFSYAPAPQQAQAAPAKPAPVAANPAPARRFSYQAAPAMTYRAPVNNWPNRIGPLHSADAKALFNY